MSLQAQLIALYTLVRKEVVRILRIWMQTLLPSAITMTLYFVIFGNLIGKRVGTMEGITYMDYIVPGLIMMAVITNSYANVSASFFSAKFQKNIEELLVSPIPNSLIILGYSAGGMTRGLIVGLLVTVVAGFFTELKIHNLFVVVSIVTFTAALFSLGGLLNGILARKFDEINIVPTFVLTPLTYLGGVFYSISLLPEFWQGVSHLNPILYMVNAFRFGFLGISDINIYIAYVVISIFIVLVFSACVFLMSRAHGLRK